MPPNPILFIKVPIIFTFSSGSGIFPGKLLTAVQGLAGRWEAVGLWELPTDRGSSAWFAGFLPVCLRLGSFREGGRQAGRWRNLSRSKAYAGQGWCVLQENLLEN